VSQVLVRFLVGIAGASYAATAAHSMIVGAIGFPVYASCCFTADLSRSH
jgi:L-cystine uptake protein TcyP (sodium:dicarboxylate symporter family)